MPVYKYYLQFVYYGDEPDCSYGSHRAIAAKTSPKHSGYRAIVGSKCYRIFMPEKFHAIHRMLINEFSPSDIFAAYCEALLYLLAEFIKVKDAHLTKWMGLRLYARITYSILHLYAPYDNYLYTCYNNVRYSIDKRLYEDFNELLHYDKYNDFSNDSIALEDDETFDDSNWLNGIDCHKNFDKYTPYEKLVLSTRYRGPVERSITTGMALLKASDDRNLKSISKRGHRIHNQRCPVCGFKIYYALNNLSSCRCNTINKHCIGNKTRHSKYKTAIDQHHHPESSAKWFTEEEASYEF